MHNRLRIGVLLPCILILALLISAFTPAAVFAEGEVPEQPAAYEETEPLAQPVENINSAAAAVQLLAESNAVIVQQGAQVPLVAQSALSILCEKDPWYYGSGPTCTGGKCMFYGETGLQEALDNWAANKGAGLIYLESGGYTLTGDYYNIDGSSGFQALKGIVTIAGQSRPVISGALSINNMPAGFTLRNITFIQHDTGSVLSFNENVGTILLQDIVAENNTDSGIRIEYHRGAVTLERVAMLVKNTGAAIDNCYEDGGICLSKLPVRVINSSFNKVYKGLEIRSGGLVTLSGVSAVANTHSGAFIQTDGGLIIRNSVFSGNTFYGLLVESSKGNVTLDNVVASGNGLVFNNSWAAVDISTTGNIVLKEVVASGNKAWHGIYLSTPGNVTLSGVRAENNMYGSGLKIALSDVPSSSLFGSGAKAVMISNSSFTQNKLTNLYVEASGAITLNNVTASISSDASAYGAFLFNRHAALSAPVTVRSSTFSSNKQSGLYIDSKGAVTLQTVIAVDNFGTAIMLFNDGSPSNAPVSILGTFGPNLIRSSAGGLNVATNGGITLRDLDVTTITLHQALYLYSELAGNINLNNVKVINAYSAITNEAVRMRTGGSISWTSGGVWGTEEDKGGRTLLSSGRLKTVTLKDLTFEHSKNDGVKIEAESGTVRLTNLAASYNQGDGIDISTTGAVFLTNITSRTNGGYGINISGVNAGNVVMNATGAYGYNRVENNGVSEEDAAVFINQLTAKKFLRKEESHA